MKKFLSTIILFVSVLSFAQVATYEIIDLANPEKKEESNNINPCSNIGEMKSKFDSNKSYFTSRSPISIEKHINKGVVTYYLSIFYYNSFLSIPSSKSEIGILFSDGSKIKKIDNDINVEYSSYDNKYQYHSFVTITSSEAKMIASKTISDYKLYIYEQEFDINDAKKLQIEAKCVYEKK